MEKQIRTRLFVNNNVAVCTKDIVRVAYVEDYVFIDENEVLTYADIQAIFEIIEERGLEIDTYTVQETADEMCPGAAITDIGGAYVNEGAYPSNMWVFGGVDEILTFGDLEFFDAVMGADGPILLDEDIDPDLWDTDAHNVCLNKFIEDIPAGYNYYVYNYKYNGFYILEVTSNYSGELDNAYLLGKYGLVNTVEDLTGDVFAAMDIVNAVLNIL